MGDTAAAISLVNKLRMRRQIEFLAIDHLLSEYKEIVQQYRGVGEQSEVAEWGEKERARAEKRRIRDKEVLERGLFQADFGNVIPLAAALEAFQRRITRDGGSRVDVIRGARVSVITLSDQQFEVRALRDEEVSLSKPGEERAALSKPSKIGISSEVEVRELPHPGSETRREFLLKHAMFVALVSIPAPGALRAHVTIFDGDERLPTEVLRDFVMGV